MTINNILSRLPQVLRGFIVPLPNPRKEADRFFSFPLHNLPFLYVQELVRLILDEVRKSRGFGLYIERRHIEREELFFLAIINSLGGAHHLRREFTFEQAHTIISKLMWIYFANEVRYYFERSKEGEVRNKYNAHLECVLSRLLREMYEGQNSHFITTEHIKGQ